MIVSEQFYSQYINQLRVPDFTDKGFKNTEDNKWDLNDLKPINIFIGANNSGKSRLIRHLFSHDILHIDSNDFPFSRFYGVTSNITSSSQSQALKQFILTEKNLSLQNIMEKLETKAKELLHDRRNPVASNPQQISKLIQGYQEESQESEVFNFISKYTPPLFTKIYIPLLRGLRTLATGDDIYKNRTINDYFPKVGEQYDIFTGHSLYENLKNSLLGTYEERARVREFETYLSKNFFNNQPLSLVPRINDNVVHFKEGNKPERPIYDLGDGLQAIIILTFKVFMATKPTMFFIEEPEQHLHASMQRSLIEAFRSHPEHMYFITTHSNHFIDLSQETDDVSVQRMYQKIDNGDEKTVIESSSKDAHILADLGVRASSVLLANCSIWVEGITDKLYLRAYMDKFINELSDKDEGRAERLRNYKENLHYIFTEYQGSNITHWDFNDGKSEDVNKATPARSVTSNIMLIADKDIDGKAERVTDLSNALGEKFELLDVKEIENLIPEIILQKTVKDKWNSKKNKTKYSANFDHTQIQQSDYSNDKGIGCYLESLVTRSLDNESQAYKFFEAASGTIKLKVDFCNTAVGFMKDDAVEWTLTDDLRTLCDKIWTHIEESN